MAGFGFGFGGRTVARNIKPFTPPGLPQVAPSEAWTGDAGSGFSTIPEDPVRSTAKPVMRPIVPADQFYTDTLLIGVVGGANNLGTLIDNMGIDRVLVHCEGKVTEISQPTFETPPSASPEIGGSAIAPQPILGWWAELKHDGRLGSVQLYFEAIPKDNAMQSRVMGPYAFHPSDTAHDAEITIDRQMPVQVGANYHAIGLDLFNHLYSRRSTVRNPRVTIVRPGQYDITGGYYAFALDGYVTIEAEVPVTIGRDTRSTAGSAGFRSKMDRLHLRGANITVDQANAAGFYNEGIGRNWFDGVRFTDSRGIYNLWQGRSKSSPSRQADPYGSYFTDCELTYCADALREQWLARNCRITSSFIDVYTGTPVVVGNTESESRSDIYDAFHDAIRVGYIGGASSATIEMTRTTGEGNRVITLKEDGVGVATFTVQANEPAYLQNTNYSQANVADWINGLPGWSAQLLPNAFTDALGEANRWQAARLSMPGTAVKGGAWGPLDVKTSPLNLQTVMDTHADIFSREGTQNNVYFACNRTWGFMGQLMFLMSPAPHEDFIIVNNAAHSPQAGNYDLQTQFGNRSSHIVFAHNSWAGQAGIIRTDHAGREFDGDGFTMFANNAIPGLGMSSPEDLDVVYDGNHTNGIDTSVPGIATNHTQGGDAQDWYVSAATGNFGPQGALRLSGNLKTPRLRYDILGKVRASAAPPGAMA